MRKFRRCCLLLVLFGLLTGLMIPVHALDETSLAVTKGCATLDAQVALNGSEKILETAKAVVLYELQSDTMVYAWQPDMLVDPSGMNKIMTAMLAIEWGDLDAVVTVTRSALNQVAIGSVSAGLKVGEEITLRDLLYCMMVGSANDAAAVIAEHICGSEPDFVGQMTLRARDLGCENTQFMNATGLSHENQYTTARDLAKITKAALENEFFVELFGVVEYTVPATNKSPERKLVTTNHLMSKATVRDQFDDRFTGGKTGALSTTDRSLISTAEHNGLRYLAVVMSAKGTVTSNGLSVKTFGSFEETRALLDYGFGKYAVRQMLDTTQIMEQFPVVGGENDVVGRPAEAVKVTLPTDANPMDVSYKCVPLLGGVKAPIQKGQVIGTVEVWFRDMCVGQSDLLAMHDVNEPGVYNFLLKPSAKDAAKSSWMTWLKIGGIVILSLVVLAGTGLLVIRMVHRSKAERRRKLRKQGRQRRR